MNTNTKTIGAIVLVLLVLGGGWLVYAHMHGPAAQSPSPEETSPAVTSTTTHPVTSVPAPTHPAPAHPASLAITAISPTSGPAGTQVHLTGTGFASTSQVVIGNGAVRAVTVNSAGTQLTFTMPGSLGAYCVAGRACPLYLILLTPKTYSVSVRNLGDVNSNAVAFTLTGPANL